MSTNKRIAIVTGGGSGIGLAIAEKFTSDGIETVIVAGSEPNDFEYTCLALTDRLHRGVANMNKRTPVNYMKSRSNRCVQQRA